MACMCGGCAQCWSDQGYGPDDEPQDDEPGVDVVAGVRYCHACGNPDCPNASSNPYWERCPAADRAGRADA